MSENINPVTVAEHKYLELRRQIFNAAKEMKLKAVKQEYDTPFANGAQYQASQDADLIEGILNAMEPQEISKG